MKFISKYCLILLCISTFGLGDSKIDWCSLTCGEEKTPNVACKDCVFEKHCAAEKVNSEKILEIHNRLRDNFASGKDSHTKGVKAANVNALTWDDDLAYTASCTLAEICRPDGTPGECYVTPKFPKIVGQNKWSLDNLTEVDCMAQSTSGVQQWYDEIKSLPSISPSYNGKDAAPTDRFTQLVWAEVTHIGCASALWTDEVQNVKHCYLFCNYGPGGNVVGGSVFKEGEPCSQCPEGMSCDSTYKNLCGNSDDRVTHIAPNSGLIIIFVLLTYKSLIL